MRHLIIVPPRPSAGVPAGAAVIAARGPRGTRILAHHNPAVPFAERCARALRDGSPVALDPAACAEAGWFDDLAGEAQLGMRGRVALAGWIGHQVRQRDLTAHDNLADRKGRARVLLNAGHFMDAFELDSRLGL